MAMQLEPPSQSPTSEEGASVTVIAADDAETFELGPEDEAAILAAIAEANRGEVVDGAELIAKLGSRD